jgi:inosine-uridine nucleoside N-ribohydrolase/formylmethanofuran dehydrogenase subunit E
MMKRILMFILGITVTISLYSHPWKPSHYVIIDTDGGIDDMRAVTMLLASPDVRVLGIIVSPGALDTETSYIKVKSLLNSFHHEGIPVAVNRNCTFRSPRFQTAINTIWGDERGIDAKDAPGFENLLEELLTAETTKVSFICLGGMSTAAVSSKEIPAFPKQVKEIVWSADGTGDKDGFNYNIDRSSSEKVLKSSIPVKIIKPFGESAFFDEPLTNSISSVSTQYAAKIAGFLISQPAAGHNFAMQATDEMVALYLHYPKLFTADTTGKNIDLASSETEPLREGCLRILKGETVAKNQVIKNFPSDPSFYSDDVAPFVTDIINKYGTDEWVSGVIANELHRHLGVFAIIGVKMGIRAREYFNTGVDEFSAVSHAGSVPPLSCMNDGIQVSTGATPGHGLLTVINDAPASPSVEFRYLNRKIRVTLKPEITEKISAELKEINFVYGLDSNIYWELVRKNSLKYWLNMDRHEIFKLEEIL